MVWPENSSEIQGPKQCPRWEVEQGTEQDPRIVNQAQRRRCEDGDLFSLGVVGDHVVRGTSHNYVISLRLCGATAGSTSITLHLLSRLNRLGEARSLRPVGADELTNLNPYYLNQLQVSLPHR